MTAYYFVNAFFHEAGHCIVALLCGAEITGFSVFHGRMWYDGGDFDYRSMAWLYVNGTLFAVLFGLLLIFVIYKLFRGLYGFISISVISFWTIAEIIAWCVQCLFPTEGGDGYYFFRFSLLDQKIICVVSFVIFLIITVILVIIIVRFLQRILDDIDNDKDKQSRNSSDGDKKES
jgi:hypothetical protein